MQPSGFLAELEFRATANSHSYATPISIGKSWTLADSPIPGASIGIPGIFELGAQITYGVNANIDFKGDVQFDFGLKATLADSAKLVADVHNPSSSSATGFDGSVTPLFDVERVNGNITIGAGAGPALAFGITVLKDLVKANVQLGLKIPTISATLDASYCELKFECLEERKSYR